MTKMSINLNANFDSGCLKDHRIQGDQIVLTPRPHPFNGQATGAWTYFCLEGAKGRELTFSFDTSDCVLHGHWTESRYYYSEDQQNWRIVDHTLGQNDQYQFTHEVRADRVWFSHSIPYPMQAVEAKVMAWLSHPSVTPVKHADNAARLMQGETTWLTPGGVNEEGSPIPPHPLYAFTISDYSTEKTPSIVIMTGNHAGEHQASYTLEGLVDWLLSDLSEAAELRQSAVISIYPMVNPDGRYGGYTRGNQIIPQSDHNRLWGEMDQGVLSNIDRIKQSIREDITQPVAFFLDIHNAELTDQQYMFANTDIHYQPDTESLLPFIQGLHDQVDNFFVKSTESYVIESENTTTKTWAKKGADGPKAHYSYTMEAGNKPEPSPQQSLDFGRAIGKALLAGIRTCT